MNHLYFGDCLDVLKELHAKHPEGFIDLIYNDPPFNSKRNYNILFEDVDLSDTKAQREAFSDTWSNVSYHDTLKEIADLDMDLYKFIKALDDIRISKSAISYLTTMAIRIKYMHMVLKDTGSFYLHCDPNMSHYLKLVCDLIFGSGNYINEIAWKRTFAHSDSKRFAKVKDIILFYTKTNNYYWSNPKKNYSTDYIAKYYHNKDSDGRIYAYDSLIKPKGSIGYFYDLLGCPPPSNGWRMTLEKATKWLTDGRIEIPLKGKIPRYKRYIDEMEGLGLNDFWDDLPPINSQAKEALGYPTQKPEALMERIIIASSNEGGLVADFFGGCGTTIAVANRLNRSWLGVDISHLAIKLVLKRLTDPYPELKKKEILSNIEISGFPKDIASAHELAIQAGKGRIKFQDWIIEFMIGGVSNQKKSGDGGFDGYITYNKSAKDKGVGIIEVKSGNVGIATLKSFIHVVDNQKVDFGVFVCFEEHVSSGMRLEANKHGKITNTNIDKIQIVTVEDLLNHKLPVLPLGADPTVFEKSTKRLDTENKDEKLF